MRPTAGAERAALLNASGSDGSASPSRAGGDPGTPASLAIVEVFLAVCSYANEPVLGEP
jgi:hypothetical protein